MDLDKLKLKTSDELNTEEKAFIKENVDKLSDEDKEAYADFLGAGDQDPPQDPPADPPADDPPADPPDKPNGYTFKSEDEAKAFVAKQVAEENERQKQAAIEAARTPAEKKYVEDNWKPKTWNEGIKTAAEAAVDILEQRQQEKTQKQEAQRKALETEWDTIVVSNKLPERTTPEGQKILKEVYDVGVKYGQPNFTKAYELWNQISGGKSLGDQAKGNAQRAAAAKIRGQTPNLERKTSMAPKSYQDLNKKSMSQLMREAEQRATK